MLCFLFHAAKTLGLKALLSPPALERSDYAAAHVISDNRRWDQFCSALGLKKPVHDVATAAINIAAEEHAATLPREPG